MPHRKIKNGLSVGEQQVHLEDLILKRAKELKVLRIERRKAASERKKMVAAEHALRVLQRTFSKCSRCDLLTLKKSDLKKAK